MKYVTKVINGVENSANFCFSFLSLTLFFFFLISKVQKNLTVGVPLLLDKDPCFRSTAKNIKIVGENIQ